MHNYFLSVQSPDCEICCDGIVSKTKSENKPAIFYQLGSNKLNLTQTNVRAAKVKKQKLALREQLWGELDTSLLWNRTTQTGFTTIPRTFPILAQIMDDMADKGKPISNTYLALWCRVFDESFIEIKSFTQLASESGFSGQRAVTTWNSRMAKLSELGFINAQAGAIGEYDYVLIYNPYLVIKKKYDDKEVSKAKYVALFSRAQEVGATDLE